jgi:hypothetical protein
LIKAVPILEKYLGAKIRFWHIASLIIAITALLNTFAAPAQAIFLSGLEQFFVNLAQQSSQAGGGTATLDANVIGLIFNLIRGVFLLLVATASLFAYNQAQQGNDWRPIVTQVGLAFVIVIAIDVVTFIFVGNCPITPYLNHLCLTLLPPVKFLPAKLLAIWSIVNWFMLWELSATTLAPKPVATRLSN